MLVGGLLPEGAVGLPEQPGARPLSFGVTGGDGGPTLSLLGMLPAGPVGGPAQGGVSSGSFSPHSVDGALLSLSSSSRPSHPSCTCDAAVPSSLTPSRDHLTLGASGWESLSGDPVAAVAGAALVEGADCPHNCGQGPDAWGVLWVGTPSSVRPAEAGQGAEGGRCLGARTCGRLRKHGL